MAPSNVSSAEHMAADIAALTGLPLHQAANLLAAAGGDPDLAANLILEGGIVDPPSPPRAPAEPAASSSDSLTQTQQRFSVLAVDGEDVEDGAGSSDEDIFALDDPQPQRRPSRKEKKAAQRGKAQGLGPKP